MNKIREKGDHMNNIHSNELVELIIFLKVVNKLISLIMIFIHKLKIITISFLIMLTMMTLLIENIINLMIIRQ